MALFFTKLMWRILPVLSVLLLLGCTYLIWRGKGRQWRNFNHLKRVSLVSLTSLVICFSVILLLGYSTQSKLPFGTSIQAITTEQQTIKEQKVAIEKKDSEIKEQLEAALDVADEERSAIWLTNNVSTIVTTEWLAEKQLLIDELSDESERKRYKNRFESVQAAFFE